MYPPTTSTAAAATSAARRRGSGIQTARRAPRDALEQAGERVAIVGLSEDEHSTIGPELQQPARLAFEYNGERSSRSTAHARPTPLLLEEREVVCGLRLTLTDEPGFWEVNGYHNYGVHGRSSGTEAT